MSERQRYELRSVADFLSVPEDKRAHCLADFRLWLVMVGEMAAHFRDVPGIKVPLDRFTWLDDGKHDAHIHVEMANTRDAAP